MCASCVCGPLHSCQHPGHGGVGSAAARLSDAGKSSGQRPQAGPAGPSTFTNAAFSKDPRTKYSDPLWVLQDVTQRRAHRGDLEPSARLLSPCRKLGWLGLRGKAAEAFPGTAAAAVQGWRVLRAEGGLTAAPGCFALHGPVPAQPAAVQTSPAQNTKSKCSFQAARFSSWATSWEPVLLLPSPGPLVKNYMRRNWETHHD